MAHSATQALPRTRGKKPLRRRTSSTSHVGPPSPVSGLGVDAPSPTDRNGPHASSWLTASSRRKRRRTMEPSGPAIRRRSSAVVRTTACREGRIDVRGREGASLEISPFPPKFTMPKSCSARFRKLRQRAEEEIEGRLYASKRCKEQRQIQRWGMVLTCPHGALRVWGEKSARY